MKILKWMVGATLLFTASGCATTPAAAPQQPRRLDSSLLRFYEPAPDMAEPQIVVNERGARRPAAKAPGRTAYPVERASVGHHLVHGPVTR